MEVFLFQKWSFYWKLERASVSIFLFGLTFWHIWFHIMMISAVLSLIFQSSKNTDWSILGSRHDGNIQSIDRYYWIFCQWKIQKTSNISDLLRNFHNRSVITFLLLLLQSRWAVDHKFSFCKMDTNIFNYDDLHCILFWIWCYPFHAAGRVLILFTVNPHIVSTLE